VGILDRFRRSKTSTETRDAMRSAAVHGEASRPQSDQEIMGDVGVSWHLLHDINLEKIKELDGIDIDTLTTEYLTSTAIRSSYVDEHTARMGILVTERALGRMEMDLEEEEYEGGFSNYLEAVNLHAMTCWQDAINGRKALLLKIQQRALEVSFREGNKRRVQ
jgi:hypothetical protein